MEHLLRASIEGALLAAAVWTACRLFPRLSPSARVTLWWCVAAKFAISLVVVSPIALPLLPARAPSVVATNVVAPIVAGGAMDAAASVAAPATDMRSLTTALLLALWGIGASIALAFSYHGWRRTRDAIARAHPVDDATSLLVRDLVARVGVRRDIEARFSADIASPMIAGLRRPVILLPASRFPLLTHEQKSMAICHELVHLRRGDLWLGCLPATVERLFFFHPLARLAAREYAFWREAACDAETLQLLGGSPHGYGHLLLTFGASRTPSTFAAAGAGGTFENLKRRIEVLGASSTHSRATRIGGASIVALAIVAVAPFEAVARSAPQPVVENVALQPVVEPVTPQLSVEPVQRVSEPARRETVRSDPTPTQSTPVAQRELRFVFFHSERVTTISGSSGDHERAKRWLRPDNKLLWFVQDGVEYIVRDPIVHREVEQLYAPLNALSELQAEVSRRQAKLSEQQGELSRIQGRYSSLQGIASGRQGKTSAQLSELDAREMNASADERRRIAQERDGIRREMAAIDDEMRELSREIRSYDGPMRELSQQIGELSREINDYSRQIQLASRDAKEGMQALIARALRDGSAQRAQ